MDRCQVAVILLDASEGVTDQDMRIAGYAADRGCGCILAINKWDLAPKDEKAARRIRADLREAARFLPYAPILTVSAKTGLRVSKIFDAARKIHAQYTTRMTTGKVNRIFRGGPGKKSRPPWSGESGSGFSTPPRWGWSRRFSSVLSAIPGPFIFPINAICSTGCGRNPAWTRPPSASISGSGPAGGKRKNPGRKNGDKG